MHELLRRGPDVTGGRVTVNVDPPLVGAGVALNWRNNQVAYLSVNDRREPPRCITCHWPAFMTNDEGLPQHKVCAERLLVESLGPANAWRVAAAGYPPKRRRGDHDGGRPGAR